MGPRVVVFGVASQNAVGLCPPRRRISNVSWESKVPDYAVIALGGKQYRVKAGETLLVDRLGEDEGKTLKPTTLMVGEAGGDITGGGTVTLKVEEHVLGPKLIAATYKAKKKIRKRRGHRSRLSRVSVESIAG